MTSMSGSSTSSSSHSSQSSLSLSRSGDEGASGGLGGGSGGVEYWKERCHTLEGSLLKFKQQASRIRELLADKMQEYEEKTREAERRAEEEVIKRQQAESKMSRLQEQFHREHPGSPDRKDKRIHQLMTEVAEKERKVVALQNQLDLQRDQRLQEAKLVEEKSVKIKEWVTNRMKELETQNERFKHENDTLRQQVDTLRDRLQVLPVPITREIHRRSIQSSTISSRPESVGSSEVSPPIPQRPPSTLLETLRRECADSNNTVVHSSPPRAIINIDTGAVEEGVEEFNKAGEYLEVDDNHESKYEPKTPVLATGPPQVRIERKVFPQQRLQQAVSILSSTNGSQEMLETPVVSPPCSAKHQPVLTLPRGGRLNSEDSPTSVSLTPKSPPSPLTPYLPQPPPNSPLPLYPFASNTHTLSALATLPRRSKKDCEVQKFFPPHMRDFTAATLDRRLMKGTDLERTQSERGRARPKPPTPPMRRLPSWENRIYAIANKGFRVPDTAGSAKRDSSYPVTDGLYTDHMFNDLTVPVYTSIKGRAAQIRSTPFTGDSSSDSDDNDDSADLHLVGSESADGTVVMSVAGPSGSKTTSSVRNHINQSSSGATKRAVSTHSYTSETSSDYALPPEDEISIHTDSSETSEPEHKLLKCMTPQDAQKENLEKCGYLTKLGGKVKSWRRRWFVLKNTELLYYKSPTDLAGKPQGNVPLDGHTRITKTESTLTFEITTSRKMFYLTADSSEDMEGWIRVLQNVLKKQAADHMLKQGKSKEIIKGWLIKTKNGRSRRCWCVLVGKLFIYYKSLDDKTPLGQLPLRGARVEEVDRSCDSESDSDDSSLPDYTLAIWPNNFGPTYLMLPTKQEKDSWLYHLTVAAGGGSGNVGTNYEQLVSKLMQVDGDPMSMYWKHPDLLHTKEPVSSPLTTLPSEDLQAKAIQLFKSCHSFTSIAIESPQIDEHVSMAQSILSNCLAHPELQNELFCQLIKQTSRHPPQHRSGVQNLLCGSHSWFTCDASPTSPTNSVGDLTDSKLNPSTPHVMLQTWQLLAMAMSLFLPKQSVLWYLKQHLQRNADQRTEMGKYAVFCQRALDRVLHNGGREARPSRMEILSILLRNPYHHSQPISIPVHFLNNTYQVISFDGSTTIQEFLQALNKTIGMRETPLSGFCLFTDDPCGKELEHCLKGHLKLCDVISKWEQAHIAHAAKNGRPETSRTVRLTYKNRLYFKSMSKSETEKERLLLTYQVNEEIIRGRFALNRDLAVELASLMAQIEFGDFRAPGELLMTHCRTGSSDRSGTPPHSQQHMTTVLEKFYPKRYRQVPPDELKFVEQVISDKWVALRGKLQQDCVRTYLTATRKWPFFGAKLFSAKIRRSDAVSHQVWLAIQEEGVAVLDHASLKQLTLYQYKHVVTFGGCKDDFMLTVTGARHAEPVTDGRPREHKTDRLIFLMNKHKILEVTMLMASYINSRNQFRSHQHKGQSRTDGHGVIGDCSKLVTKCEQNIAMKKERSAPGAFPGYAKQYFSSSVDV